MLSIATLVAIPKHHCSKVSISQGITHPNLKFKALCSADSGVLCPDPRFGAAEGAVSSQPSNQNISS